VGGDEIGKAVEVVEAFAAEDQATGAVIMSLGL
jgi:hypothetical protein